MARPAGALILLSLAACGGSGGGGGTSPTAPAPTATSISVTLNDIVLVGTNVTAAATATMSNGQSQPVTTGWRSDAASIATVTDGGTVRGVANGDATIIVLFGGREGSKRIRVAPNYHGTWQGNQLVTACSASGDFAGVCEEADAVGQLFPITLTARQADLQISGEFVVENLPYPTFATVVESDGTIRFSSAATVEGIRAEVAWVMNSSQDGTGTGTVREKYSAPGILSGEVTYDSNLSSFTRSAAAMSSSMVSRIRLAAVAGRLKGRR